MASVFAVFFMGFEPPTTGFEGIFLLGFQHSTLIFDDFHGSEGKFDCAMSVWTVFEGVCLEFLQF